MFKLCEVWRTSKADREAFLWRVRVYSLPDAQVWTPLDRARCAAFWKRQHNELAAFIKEHSAAVLGELDFKRFKLMGEFLRHVSDILATMADIVQPHGLDELKKYAFNDLPSGASPDTD